MQTQIEGQLRDWNGPPLILVQPRVEHISMFAFDKTPELIEAGYRATAQTLDQLGDGAAPDRARHAPDPPASGAGGRAALRRAAAPAWCRRPRCSGSTRGGRPR